MTATNGAGAILVCDDASMSILFILKAHKCAKSFVSDIFCLFFLFKFRLEFLMSASVFSWNLYSPFFIISCLSVRFPAQLFSDAFRALRQCAIVFWIDLLLKACLRTKAMAASGVRSTACRILKHI